MREKILPHVDEGTHDVDVDFDGFGTPEDAGKHGDALFLSHTSPPSQSPASLSVL